MNPYLMYPDRDWEPPAETTAAEAALVADLELDTLVQAMAADDSYLAQVARQGLLSGLNTDPDTIRYRQGVLKDCLAQEAVVRGMYRVAVEAIEAPPRRWLAIVSRYPEGILQDGVRLLRVLMAHLAELRGLVDAQAGPFESDGFRALFARLSEELPDSYFQAVDALLDELRFRDGLLLSAELGPGNQGVGYVLRRQPLGSGTWLQRLLRRDPQGYTFRLADRDEAGAKALRQIRERGVNTVANAVAQSCDHVQGFFRRLRQELGFYLGGVNLYRALTRLGLPICWPTPAAGPVRTHRCVELQDPCLALTMARPVVGNCLAADGIVGVVVTGANQGGKSTFLRSIGVAQVMMQAGLFVTAEAFAADVCHGLYTHYRREEDATVHRGKLEEELARMSDIVTALTPRSMVLLNESFAATNEREGSEIARQVVGALVDAGVKVFYVTHLQEFALRLWEQGRPEVLFLVAERREDGQRTFRVLPGAPQGTSYGVDLWAEVFGDDGVAAARSEADRPLPELDTKALSGDNGGGDGDRRSG